MPFKALPIGHQNEQISSDFLLDFKGAFPFTMTVSKSTDFKENEQNEHISMKLKKCTYSTEITDSHEFSKESLIPFAVSSQKTAYFQ